MNYNQIRNYVEESIEQIDNIYNDVKKIDFHDTINHSGQLCLPGEVSGFDKINDILSDAAESLDMVFDLVIMGDFNSGKSTFINALVGENIAATDITEMTSSLQSITFGELKKTKVVTNDGKKIVDSPEEISNLLSKQNIENPDFLRDISIIETEYPYKELKEIKIWDSPGLGSMNKRNKDITMNFISKSDAVVWLFNINLLGQEAEYKYIEQVKKYGRCIIALINRLDEIWDCPVQEAKQRAIDYVQKTYTNIFKAIFAISAKNAIDAQQIQDSKGLESSGVPSVKQWLIKNIFRKKKYLLYTATIGTLISTTYDVDAYLRKFISIYKEKLSSIHTFEKHLNFHSSNSCSLVTNQIINLIKETFLVEEEKNMYKYIEENYDELIDTVTIKNMFKKTTDKIVIEKYQQFYIDQINYLIEGELPKIVDFLKNDIEQELRKFKMSNLFYIEQMGMMKSDTTVYLSMLAPEGVKSATWAAASFVLHGIASGIGSIAGTILGLASGFSAVVSIFILGDSILKYLTGDCNKSKSQVLLNLSNNFNRIRNHFVEKTKNDFETEIEKIYKQINLKITEKFLNRFIGHSSIQSIEEKINYFEENRRQIELIRKDLKKYRNNINSIEEQPEIQYSAKNFQQQIVIDRENTEPGLKSFLTILENAEGFIKINDRYFNSKSMKLLSHIPSHIPVFIITYELDENIDWHQRILRDLQNFRNNRQGVCQVKIIKYRNRSGTPLHDRFLLSENYSFQLGNSLNAIGLKDISITPIKDHLYSQEVFFDKYWEPDKYNNNDIVWIDL